MGMRIASGSGAVVLAAVPSAGAGPRCMDSVSSEVRPALPVICMGRLRMGLRALFFVAAGSVPWMTALEMSTQLRIVNQNPLHRTTHTVLFLLVGGAVAAVTAMPAVTASVWGFPIVLSPDFSGTVSA